MSDQKNDHTMEVGATMTSGHPGKGKGEERFYTRQHGYHCAFTTSCTSACQRK